MSFTPTDRIMKTGDFEGCMNIGDDVIDKFENLEPINEDTQISIKEFEYLTLSYKKLKNTMDNSAENMIIYQSRMNQKIKILKKKIGRGKRRKLE